MQKTSDQLKMFSKTSTNSQKSILSLLDSLVKTLVSQEKGKDSKAAEVDYFLKQYVPSFSLSLDEITQEEHGE